MVSPNILKQHPFFTSLTEAQRITVAALTCEVQLPAGSALFHQGGSAEALFVLLAGRVALYHVVRSEAGATVQAAEAMHIFMEEGEAVPLLDGQADFFQEYLVGDAAPEEIIGISALVPPHRLTATARTTAPSRLLKIDAVALRASCDADPRLGCVCLAAIAQTAMQRLQTVRQQLVVR